MNKKSFIYKLRCLHGSIHWSIYGHWNKLKDKYNFFITYIIPVIKFKIKNRNGFFLLLTPEHGNLGDHAIAFAEQKLLEQAGLKYYEITEAELSKYTEFGYLNIFNKRPIILNGGGNLGTLWYNVEKLTRALIRSNPSSVIFIFPNTIFYEKSAYGQEELEKSIKIYNSHKNLHIYAREKTSFELMHKIYNNVKLIPDIVFSLDKTENPQPRKGCILCLRSDIERTLPDSTEQKITALMRQYFNDFSVSDMNVDYSIPKSNRKFELEKKFNQFKNSELVITDRLHCMIFCAITETPCILLNSKSPKIKGCYEWVTDSKYIRFSERIEDIPNIWQEIQKEKYKFNSEFFKPFFEEITNDLFVFTKNR